ncbi:Tat pathway signal sequence domain protein [Streptomyces sp. NPDC001796]|uniref:Tat pathway signal sequence domain protein n=1 Tax=Streptomyces sp. NPDC001796 TaxID=3364609 RepID=UPI003696C09A
MSGVGPLEPGEGTHAGDVDTDGVPGVRRGPLARLPDRHRRAVLTAATAAVLLAGGGYLYATRPHKPPAPAPPYPSQVVDITYLHTEATPRGAPAGSFSFEVALRVQSGPPVTVTRMAQPYAGLSLTSEPAVPFRTAAGSIRKITITMHVTDCAKAPENAGLPFLDVTLRNTHAIEAHSYIPGPRYAHDLSQALQVACSNRSR